jgi:hypothetical protein
LLEGGIVGLETLGTARQLLVTAFDLGAESRIGLGLPAASQVCEPEPVRLNLRQLEFEHRQPALKVSPPGLVLSIPHRGRRLVTRCALLVHALRVNECRLNPADVWNPGRHR